MPVPEWNFSPEFYVLISAGAFLNSDRLVLMTAYLPLIKRRVNYDIIDKESRI
jgi:hypothetical protein